MSTNDSILRFFVLFSLPDFLLLLVITLKWFGAAPEILVVDQLATMEEDLLTNMLSVTMDQVSNTFLGYALQSLIPGFTPIQLACSSRGPWFKSQCDRKNFLFLFWVVIYWLLVTLKWSIHELIHHVWLSIRLNNLIDGHKTKWTENNNPSAQICFCFSRTAGATSAPLMLWLKLAHLLLPIVLWNYTHFLLK